jgi:hypothetical protein
VCGDPPIPRTPTPIALVSTAAMREPTAIAAAMRGWVGVVLLRLAGLPAEASRVCAGAGGVPAVQARPPHMPADLCTPTPAPAPAKAPAPATVKLSGVNWAGHAVGTCIYPRTLTRRHGGAGIGRGAVCTLGSGCSHGTAGVARVHLARENERALEGGRRSRGGGRGDTRPRLRRRALLHCRAARSAERPARGTAHPGR